MTIELATLRDWIVAKLAEYVSRGIVFNVVQGGVDTPDPSYYVDIETSHYMGRICCWSSGQCDMEIIETCEGNQILYEWLEHVSTRNNLDSALDTYLERVLELEGRHE